MINTRNFTYKIRLLTIALSVTIGLAIIGATAAFAAMGGTLSGTITDPNGGLPPVGTVVELFEPGRDTVFAHAQVDEANGQFSLGPIPNGVYFLKAVPPTGSGFTQSRVRTVSVLGGSVEGISLKLTMPQLTGVVTKPDGTTPVSATVRVLLAGVPVQVVDAPAGAFEVGGLLARNYKLQAHPVTDEPFWNSPRELITVMTTTQAITLSLSQAQMWGTAEDHLGNPVARANVVALSRGSLALRHHDQTRASGYWAIGGLPNGDYRLFAEPPVYQHNLIAPAPIDLTLPGANNPYLLTFGAASKVVTGNVTVNLNGGTPVEQALVVARRTDRHGEAQTLTDAAGHYTLRLSAGLWALTVKETDATNPAHWVYPQSPQLVHFRHNADPEEKTKNFRVFQADAAVSGVVELPGGGTPSFTVTVGIFNNEGVGRRATIDPNNGAFSIRVPHGGYKVVIHPHSRFYLGPRLAPIRLEPNEDLDLGTVTLTSRNASITGTVYGSDGFGVEGIPVTAWRTGTPDTLRVRTGSDGNYILPVTAGRWHIQPAPGPRMPYIYQGNGEAVIVEAGEIITDVDFTLVTANATLIGQLVDETTSQPLNDVDGWAKAVNKADGSLKKGAPIQAGHFTILVPAGDYRVAAFLGSGSPYMSGADRDVSVTAGETVTLTLSLKEKDAIIQGALWNPREAEVVTGVDGLVGAFAEGNMVGTNIDKGNGTYRFGVAAGLWHLGYRLDPSDGYVKLIGYKNVPIQSGQTIEVPLPVVQKDAAISGVVLGPNGSPRGGVTVIAHAIRDNVTGITLKTISDENGRFNLAVPYGHYRLGAAGGGMNLIKPVEKVVEVRPNQTSTGHVLQFQEPNAVISGTLTISGTSTLAGEALIWAWSDDGGFIKGHFPISNSIGIYSLNVVSGTTWHLGAVFETNLAYWGTRTEVAVSSTRTQQDLVLIGPHAKPAPVVVTFDAAEPQRILLADGTHIFIPAGAMPVVGEVTLRVVPIATLPHQRRANIYKYGYAFLATDENDQPIEDHFNQDVIIGLAYTDAELVRLGIREDQIKPVYFSTTEDEWTAPESYAVDNDRNILTMQIDHFTDFVLSTDNDEPLANSVYLPITMR